MKSIVSVVSPLRAREDNGEVVFFFFWVCGEGAAEGVNVLGKKLPNPGEPPCKEQNRIVQEEFLNFATENDISSK